MAKANNPEEEREKIERALSERLEAHDKSRKAAQESSVRSAKSLKRTSMSLRTELAASSRRSPLQRATASRAHLMISRWMVVML